MNKHLAPVKTKQFTTIAYGLTTIAAGIWRHLQTGDSQQAVWFGVVMGTIAIAGAILLQRQNKIPAYLLILISLGFVSGWFLNRMISGHSDGKSIRVIIILTACAIESFVLLDSMASRLCHGHLRGGPSNACHRKS
ncbi:MAG: hypothetical protein KAH23_05500 [Kiritimatiellae bacterium]|nr:hypothetical protein [Kiritimatiellia bacterium]